ncbi:MAG: LodA/GoxA family CTQ-dependent oxidase [Actinomycetota bacterium]
MTLLSRREFLEAAAVTGAAAAVGVGSASPVAASDLSRVARVAIHPAVGFARVGNSQEAFYFGPEVPGMAPRGPFKDPQGAMAKQAARFRIYGYDNQGRVLGEITAADAEITWSVNVANAKPIWYDPAEAFDVPNPPDCRRRNPEVIDRRTLVAHAAPRTVKGAGAEPRPLDGGTFLGLSVGLGEILTDKQGRLIVMPADGRAIQGPDAPPLTGLSSDGWTDDTCDGPVNATVRINGRTLKATPAYVVSTSPDWGPSVPEGIVTLYDAIEGALYKARRRKKPPTVFSRDIYPIFRRMTDTQWVNEGFFNTNGWGSPADWTTPALRRKLADGSKANLSWRRKVFAAFRDPGFVNMEPDLMPALYGDKITIPPNLVQPRQWLAVTALQYAHLRAWSEGNFTDIPESATDVLSDLPTAEQPAALDRASLGACLGGAFHPGIEFTWLARIAWMWTDDMRIKATLSGPNYADYGPLMTQEIALSRSGPLSKIGPGSIGQWMGLPWHSDSSSCRSGYSLATSPVSPTFWPARIPNQVLAEEDYDVVMDPERSLAERRAAFDRRRGWERFIAGPTGQQAINAMITDWYKLGVVTQMPGPKDGFFPATMKVETGVGFASEPAFDYGAYFTMPQLPQFPIMIGCSDDNSIRLITANGDESEFWVDKPLARPEGMARDSAGNLYVACMNDGTIAKVSPRGYVTTYATDLGTVVGLYMTQGNILFATDFSDDGRVFAITAENTVKTLVPAGSGLRKPVGVVINPVTNTLLVSSATDGTVWSINPADGSVVSKAWATGLPGPRLMCVDLMQHVWVASASPSGPPVYRFDGTGRPLPLQLVGTDVHGIMGVANDSRNRLYLTNPLRNLVARITMSGNVGTVEPFAYAGANPGGLVFNG